MHLHLGFYYEQKENLRGFCRNFRLDDILRSPFQSKFADILIDEERNLLRLAQQILRQPNSKQFS